MSRFLEKNIVHDVEVHMTWDNPKAQFEKVY